MSQHEGLIELREAQPEDAGGIFRFFAGIDADYPIPPSTKVDLRDWAEKVLRLGFGYLVLCDGDVVGGALGYANSPQGNAWLSMLGVDRQYRRIGLAGELLNAFECGCARKGMTRVYLNTNSMNELAIDMYRKRGYRVSSFPDAKGDFVMCKQLTAVQDSSSHRAWISEERPNILLTSVGRRTYLVEWFREALAGQGEVHVVNSSSLSPAFAAADKATICPQIYDNGYIPFLVDYCKLNRIGALVPLFDVDIPVLASRAAELREVGCLPVVATPEVASACNDKLLSEKWLRSAGIPTTRSFISLDDALRSVDSGKAAFPLVIKPRWGMGSIGVEIARSRLELEALYGVVFRRIQDSYLRFESSADMGSAVLVQPVLAGQEWGMDVISDLDGNLRGVVTRKKLAMRSGETDVAEVVPTPPELFEVAKRIAAKSRHPGNMDVDLFVEEGGKVRVLEMNARFGGGYPFGHAAGVNLPHALVEWLRGNTGYSEGLAPMRCGTYCKDLRVVEMAPASCCE